MPPADQPLVGMSFRTDVPVTPDPVQLASGHLLPVVAFYAPGTGLTPCDIRTGGAAFANFWPLPERICVEHNGVKGTFQNSEAAYQCLKWWQDASTRVMFESCSKPGFQGGEDAFQLKRKCEQDPRLASVAQLDFDGLGKMGAMMLVLRIKWRLPGKDATRFELSRPRCAVPCLHAVLTPPVTAVSSRSPGFRELLISTAGMLLLEHSAREGRDPYWTDDCVGGGQNRLGAALMIVRDELLREAGLPTGWPRSVPMPSWICPFAADIVGPPSGRSSDSGWQSAVDAVAERLCQLDGRHATAEGRTYDPLQRPPHSLHSNVVAPFGRQEAADATPGCAACIGLIGDPQYADQDDQQCIYVASRRYRGVLPLLSRAARALNHAGASLVVQLGDLIDGANVKMRPPQSDTALERTLRVFDELACGAHNVHHLVGNNELRNFSRRALETTATWIGRDPLACEPPARASRLHYTVKVTEQWRLVVLNTFHTSVLGAIDGDEGAAARVKAFLRAHPRWLHLAPSDALSSYVELLNPWPNPAPSDDFDRRLAANNGACDEAQVAWLRQTLSAACAASERVIVCGHNPILPAAVNDLDSLAWDYDNVLGAIRDEGRTCVAAYVAGHDHRGGYARDGPSGVHHITMPAPLEAEPDGRSRFAIAKLFSDGTIVLQGEGDVRVEPMEPLQRYIDLAAGVLLDPPLGLRD